MNDLNIAWKGTSLVIPKNHKELIALFEAEKISFQPRGDIEADNDVILENRKTILSLKIYLLRISKI